MVTNFRRLWSQEPVILTLVMNKSCISRSQQWSPMCWMTLGVKVIPVVQAGRLGVLYKPSGSSLAKKPLALRGRDVCLYRSLSNYTPCVPTFRHFIVSFLPTCTA